MTQRSLRRPRGELVGLVVALVVAAACAGAPTADEPQGQPGQSDPAPSASVTQRADGTTSIEEFESDINGAVQIAERYWAGKFDESGERFVPIRRVVTYQRDGELDCAGQAVPRNNAVYCPAGDFIAYDVRWAVAAFRQIGDAFLFYLLGHEYAHGVQARLGIESKYTIQHELQADCMAGAYIGDSERSKALTVEEGDMDELREGLLAVADDEGQPWFAEGSHGTGEQRTEAFFRGYEQSLDSCGLR